MNVEAIRFAPKGCSARCLHPAVIPFAEELPVMPKLRVLLADDHAIVREGLKHLIETQPDMQVVGEAANGEEALTAASRLMPDIVVMDVGMPRLNGARATERLKNLYPNIKVLTLTVHEDALYLRQALEAGACGYVLKRTAADDLVRALRSLASGGTYVDPNVSAKLVSLVQRQPRSMTAGQILSDRETEVLREIASGYTNKEIATRLGVSTKTVETYRSRGMEKLGLTSRVDIVRLATERGWLQAAPVGTAV
jgi:DNA-binding NarL/FixJ family response regulator